MAMVRFATTCDLCIEEKRSPEYTAWPSCRECLQDVCPEHQVAGSLKESDGKETVLCVECATDEPTPRATACETCGYPLRPYNPVDTSTWRTDNFCSARCKRRHL